MHCKPLSIEYVMYVYGLCLLFDFAIKNLHLATIFYHLVAKWRLNNFFLFQALLWTPFLPFKSPHVVWLKWTLKSIQSAQLSNFSG